MQFSEPLEKSRDIEFQAGIAAGRNNEIFLIDSASAASGARLLRPRLCERALKLPFPTPNGYRFLRSLYPEMGKAVPRYIRAYDFIPRIFVRIQATFREGREK